MAKPPSILVLGPITPTTVSANQEVLEYDRLEPAVEKQRPYDGERWREFLTTEKNVLEEQRLARNLASTYLLETALESTVAVSAEQRQLWADRFTQQSAELYGAPDRDRAIQLGVAQAETLLEEARAANLDSSLISRFDSARNELGLQGMGEKSDTHPYRAAAEAVRNFFRGEYSEVLDRFGAGEQDAPLDANAMAERMEAGLDVLRTKDVAWNGWKVVRKQGSDKLSVAAANEEALVGQDRADMSVAEFIGTASHELLVHGLRAVNGAKIDPQLAKGLPDYLDAEEGVSGFVEYALTGKVPDKIVDRYVDIAIALGLTTGSPVPRATLTEFVSARHALRQALHPTQEESNFQKSVQAHVNRIYRGSRGDEYVGVFTKDIAYYVGFEKVGQYISKELETGKSTDQVIEFLLLGKFDPTNAEHVTFVKTALAASKNNALEKEQSIL